MQPCHDCPQERGSQITSLRTQSESGTGVLACVGSDADYRAFRYTDVTVGKPNQPARWPAISCMPAPGGNWYRRHRSALRSLRTRSSDAPSRARRPRPGHLVAGQTAAPPRLPRRWAGFDRGFRELRMKASLQQGRPDRNMENLNCSDRRYTSQPERGDCQSSPGSSTLRQPARIQSYEAWIELGRNLRPKDLDSALDWAS